MSIMSARTLGIEERYAARAREARTASYFAARGETAARLARELQGSLGVEFIHRVDTLDQQ